MAFTIKQFDTSPSIRATLKDAAGTPVLLNGATVQIVVKTLDGVVVIEEPMTITTPLAGGVEYDWQTGDTSVAGTYFVEFEVTYTDLSIETFPNDGFLPLVITPRG
jgi:uncharacterized protein YfaS (alpha-2-macroglobulin family)